MRPQDSKAWRKDGRERQGRRREHELRPEAPTRRQQAQALVAETEELLARQARIDEGWDLPFLVGEGVQVLTLGEPVDDLREESAGAVRECEPNTLGFCRYCGRDME